jgi:RNA polymerase sigma-70 factor (ECF subfamily)
MDDLQTARQPSGGARSRTGASDAELLLAARDGHGDAFGVFYERHHRAILRYLTRQTRLRDVAADLTAETFATALAIAREGTRPLPASPRAWLYAVARYLLIEAVRRGEIDASARLRLSVELRGHEDERLDRIADVVDAAETVEALARDCPKTDWTLLRARLVDEEPYAELAGRMRCSEAVVRKRVSRAITQLRTALHQA